MSARLLDGKAIAGEIQSETAQQVADFVSKTGVTPCLAAVLVGEDPASQIYVRNKQRACERVGIESRLARLSAGTSEDELLKLIAALNQDAGVHAILVQLPLPEQIRSAAVLDAIHPVKDVDCFHPNNVGRLMQGRPRYLPCTPHGVQQILARSDIQVSQRHVVIVGRSEIVGKPLAAMLIQRDAALGARYANGTVCICHSRTDNLSAITREADILVAAVGRPRLITAEMVKPGATVIDVGVNRTDDGLVGDVDFAAVREVAGAITPVPKGVGPLTITMLLHNTLAAAQSATSGSI